ncbi:MAG: hypothetical protein QOF18_3013 [Frankiaceae bacterium]|nr:hypothetical protein [Frankiaceae bacterium]
MNTPQGSEHDRWEELAAGYALHALEPDEEATFLAHLETCAHCRAVLDDHSFVAAQLGALADDAGVTTPSWSSIRDVVVPPGTATAPTPATPSGVVSLDVERSRRRQPRLLTAAAAAVLIAGAGTAAWQLASGGSQSSRSSAIAACEQATGCHVVHLDGTAVVLATASQARVLATSLKAPAAGHVYALWQLPRDGSPMLVTLLPAVSQDRPGPSAALRLPYADTAAFAISEEPADVTPTHPTDVVATGTALA